MLQGRCKLDGVEEEEAARLSGELQWLREVRGQGDRRLQELEDMVALLRAENSNISSSLETERGKMGSRSGRPSTVEEEVMALESVAQGVLCRRCLGITEMATPQVNLYPTSNTKCWASRNL